MPLKGQAKLEFDFMVKSPPPLKHGGFLLFNDIKLYQDRKNSKRVKNKRKKMFAPHIKK